MELVIIVIGIVIGMFIMSVTIYINRKITSHETIAKHMKEITDENNKGIA